MFEEVNFRNFHEPTIGEPISIESSNLNDKEKGFKVLNPYSEDAVISAEIKCYPNIKEKVLVENEVLISGNEYEGTFIISKEWTACDLNVTYQLKESIEERSIRFYHFIDSLYEPEQELCHELGGVAVKDPQICSGWLFEQVFRDMSAYCCMPERKFLCSNTEGYNIIKQDESCGELLAARNSSIYIDVPERYKCCRPNPVTKMNCGDVSGFIEILEKPCDTNYDVYNVKYKDVEEGYKCCLPNKAKCSKQEGHIYMKYEEGCGEGYSRIVSSFNDVPEGHICCIPTKSST